jgi:hypothetical protein
MVARKPAQAAIWKSSGDRSGLYPCSSIGVGKLGQQRIQPIKRDGTRNGDFDAAGRPVDRGSLTW